MKYTFAFYYIALIFICGGCATIIKGTKQTVTIDSYPQGAEVKLNNKPAGITPLVIKQRATHPLVIEFSHRDYENRYYVLNNKFQWQWLLLDAPLTYGPVCIPFAIDMITMAPYRFVSNHVYMNFDSAYVPPVLPSYMSKNIVDSNGRIDASSEALVLYQERLRLEREERQREAERKRREAAMLRQERIRIERMQDSLQQERKKLRVKAAEERYRDMTSRYKNYVGIQLPSLFLGELDLYYQRTVYKGISIGVEGGYKIPDRTSHEFSNNDALNVNGPVDEMMFMPFTESYYMGIGAKIPVYGMMRGKGYVSFVGFNRNTGYDHALITWEDQIDRYVIKRYYDSVGIHQNTYGLKCLAGIQSILPLGKIALQFDLYAGMSWRNIFTDIYHYQRTSTVHGVNSVDFVNKEEVIPEFVPLPQAGVKIGFRF